MVSQKIVFKVTTNWFQITLVFIAFVVLYNHFDKLKRLDEYASTPLAKICVDFIPTLLI